jgi:hypothetical protein
MARYGECPPCHSPVSTSTTTEPCSLLLKAASAASFAHARANVATYLRRNGSTGYLASTPTSCVARVATLSP